MTIKFYKFSGDEREINKSLTDESDIEGTLRDQADILSPVIAVQTDPTAYNYCQIPKFNRYYFVHTCVQYRKGIWILHLKEDPLYTYRDEILQLTGIVSQLNDTSYISGAGIYDVRATHERIDFTDKLELGSHILIVRGN